MNGSLAIYYRDRCLATTEAPAEAPMLRVRENTHASPPTSERRIRPTSSSSKPATVKSRRPWKPPKHHPWRRHQLKSWQTRRIPIPRAVMSFLMNRSVHGDRQFVLNWRSPCCGGHLVEKEIGPTSHWPISFLFQNATNFRGDIFPEHLKVSESLNSNIRRSNHLHSPVIVLAYG